MIPYLLLDDTISAQVTDLWGGVDVVFVPHSYSSDFGLTISDFTIFEILSGFWECNFLEFWVIFSTVSTKWKL